MPLCHFLAVSNCPPTYCLMKDVFCGHIAAVYRCFAHIHMFCCSYHAPLMLGCIFQQSAYLSAGLTRTYAFLHLHWLNAEKWPPTHLFHFCMHVHWFEGESAFCYFAVFAVYSPLPEEIRRPKILSTFKSRLKTHLFSCAFVEWALCYIRTDCTIYNHFLFLTVLNSFKNIFLYLLLIFFLFYFCIPCFYYYF